MALIPNAETLTLGTVAATDEVKNIPTRTYKINWAKKRAEGYTDDLAAMEQAIYKIIHTERFVYLIYSWDYGTELNSLIGESRAVAEAELERIFAEALLADTRVEKLADFTVSQSGRDALAVTFTVITIFGAIAVEREVKNSA
ncbi:MAG: DUF2634 domain-containing protein [Oscillospiraceae bacterium]